MFPRSEKSTEAVLSDPIALNVMEGLGSEASGSKNCLTFFLFYISPKCYHVGVTHWHLAPKLPGNPFPQENLINLASRFSHLFPASGAITSQNLIN